MSKFGDELEFEFVDEFEAPETMNGVRSARRLGTSTGGRDRYVGIGRLAVLIVVAIATVVSAASLLTGSSASYAGYFASVGALARSSSRAGALLANGLESLNSRSMLLARLQALAVEDQQVFDQAESIRPPGPLRMIHRELLAALELRASGLAGLDQVLMSAVSSNAATSSAADALHAQARLLMASDVVWDQLYRAPAAALLRAHRGRVVVPSSRFVVNGALMTSSAFVRLLQRFRGVLVAKPALLLKSGTTGSAVAVWQRQLNRWLRTQPGQAPLAITRSFDAPTEAATKALQQAARISSDGIVGPATRQALKHQLVRTG